MEKKEKKRNAQSSLSVRVVKYNLLLVMSSDDNIKFRKNLILILHVS